MRQNPQTWQVFLSVQAFATWCEKSNVISIHLAARPQGCRGVWRLHHLIIPLVLTPEPCEESEGEVPLLEDAWEEV